MFGRDQCVPHCLRCLSAFSCSRSGFNGCNFNDPFQVQLPVILDGLKYLDISENSWLPMELVIYPSLLVLKAARASVLGLYIESTSLDPLASDLPLAQIDTSDNVFAEYNSAGLSQLEQWAALFAYRRSLESVSCNNCSLQFNFNDLIGLTSLLNSGQLQSQGLQPLQVLRLSNNNLNGFFCPQLFDYSVKLAVGACALPNLIQQIDISNNPSLTSECTHTHHTRSREKGTSRNSCGS